MIVGQEQGQCHRRLSTNQRRDKAGWDDPASAWLRGGWTIQNGVLRNHPALLEPAARDASSRPVALSTL